jgi:hypothetical protein
MIHPAFKTGAYVMTGGRSGIVEDVNPGWDDDEPRYRITTANYDGTGVASIVARQSELDLPGDKSITEVAGLLRELIGELRKDRAERREG